MQGVSEVVGYWGWVQREERAVDEGIAASMMSQNGSPALVEGSQADSDDDSN